MRLIHTTKYELCEFATPPCYAILSHTWDHEEVSLQDFLSSRRTTRRGWAKVISCCKLAAREGFDYVWIDTCCIDKSSSADLSEAINSMFHWYQEAEICYAHLSDCTGVICDDFMQARYHTRGWTLQELLAPRFVLFVDSQWKEIGTRNSLTPWLTRATGIPVSVLESYDGNQSVAQKMSWAANRSTTRVEDMAYSLMGLFNINMPLLYGEGNQAFKRLQMEIIRNNDDETVFVHEAPFTASDRDSDSDIDVYPDTSPGRPLLAWSPSDFRKYSDVDRFPEPQFLRQGLSVTDRGMEVRAPVLVNFPPEEISLGRLLPLNCGRRDGSAFALRLCGLDVEDKSQYGVWGEPIEISLSGLPEEELQRVSIDLGRATQRLQPEVLQNVKCEIGSNLLVRSAATYRGTTVGNPTALVSFSSATSFSYPDGPDTVCQIIFDVFPERRYEGVPVSDFTVEIRYHPRFPSLELHAQNHGEDFRRQRHSTEERLEIFHKGFRHSVRAHLRPGVTSVGRKRRTASQHPTLSRALRIIVVCKTSKMASSDLPLRPSTDDGPSFTRRSR